MPSFDPYTHVIKPMLAESREAPFDSPDHIFELKWDGTRALAFVRNGLRFQNRRLNFIEDRYPDLKVHTRKDAILDGEIVVMKGALPSFEKLQERERASGKINIEYLAWTLPVLVAEAHFLEWSKDRRMRAPSFSRMRDDKRPEDCIVTFP